MSLHTVFVIDKDIQLLQALRVCLRSAGFNVVLAQVPAHAEDKVQDTTPDLLIVCIDAPEARSILAEGPLADVPAIYLTSATPEAVQATAIGHGAYAVLHKPLDAAKLMTTVRAALGDAVRAPERLA